MPTARPMGEPSPAKIMWPPAMGSTADVRPRLLVGVGVVHLRHFFRGFKTAGESPIYELHGGDPFVVWRDV